MLRSRSVVVVAALLVGAGLLFAAGQLLASLDRPQPHVKELAKQPHEERIAVMITGQEIIPALLEDYRLPASQWVVVSKTRPLPDAHYVPHDLRVPSRIAVNDQKSQEEQSISGMIEAPLEHMLTDATAAGLSLFIGSGYRSYELQNTYYSNYVRTSGEAEANKFSAKPGYSEHQTGLSVDISLVSRDCYLETCFGETAAGKWLAAHAHEYGFILRYPADKSDITGYLYEPWHFRYVGKDLAGALYRSKLALDEIIPQLESTRTQLIQHGKITE